jgi:hypothetical protein
VEADDLGALLLGVTGELLVLVEHRVLVAVHVVSVIAAVMTATSSLSID